MASGTQKLIGNIGKVTGANGTSYVFAMLDEDSGTKYPAVRWVKDVAGTTLNPPKLHILSVDSFKDFIRLKNGTASPLLDFDQLADGDDYADASGYITASNVTDLSATKWEYPADATAEQKYFALKGDGITDATIDSLKLADSNNDGVPDNEQNGGGTSNSLFGIDFTGKLDFLKSGSLTGVGKYWDDFVSFVEKNPIIVAGAVYLGWKPIFKPLWKKVTKLFR